MVEKKALSIPKDQTEYVINKFSNLFGYPVVRNLLTVYIEKGQTIRIDISAEKIEIFYFLSKREKNVRRVLIIDNTHIEALCNIIKQLGVLKGNIHTVTQYRFKCPENNFQSINVVEGTPIGNIVEFEQPQGKEDSSEIIQRFQTILGIGESLSIKNIQEKVKKTNVSSETLLDSLGILNNKIIDFLKANCIGRENFQEETYLHRLQSLSNDYSIYEPAFKKIFKNNLLSYDPIIIQNRFNVNVSIIIPCFNAENSILHTLSSIKYQKLISTETLNELEVILIDDGSKIPISKIVDPAKYPFEIKIVSCLKNFGISYARNIGATIASGDILLFIDADILLTPNYLAEHVARHKTIPNCILISFKENVDIEDWRISKKAIQKGLVLPDYRNDLRIFKAIGEEQMSYREKAKEFSKEDISPLAETNFFKDLSFGRVIGVYDLPGMVIGHNFSIKKKTFTKSEGFPLSITGYGLEDALFGLKIIAQGNFVIPVVSCGVFHINHPPRRGTPQKVQAEFTENIEKVKKMLHKKINES